jgi:GxxExxY protein
MKRERTGRFSDGSDLIIAACIEVHRHLGPGLLESTYERCLCVELEERGIPFERQLYVPINYKGFELDGGYRLDLLIDGELVVEIKAVEKLLPIRACPISRVT